MAENIEKLARLGRDKLREGIDACLNGIENVIEGRVKYYPKEILQGCLSQYLQAVRESKEWYGVEFLDLNKRYKKILPKINKYNVKFKEAEIN